MSENEKKKSCEVSHQEWLDAVRSAHTSTLDTLRRMYEASMVEFSLFEDATTDEG